MSQTIMPIDRRARRKRSVLVVAAALLLVGGGSAWAYWTTGGSGSGTARTGTSQVVQIIQTSTISGLAPGSPVQTLSGTFTNTNPGPIYVTSVTASIASVTKAANAAEGACTAGDFTLTESVMLVGREIPAGAQQEGWTGAKISFNNDPSRNQDACKNATVNFLYSSS